jgi:hypothetical protein
MTQPPELLPEKWTALTQYRAPRFSWSLIGVSDRATADRMARLVRSSQAKRVLTLLEDSDDKSLAQLEAIAKINGEQAEAAFRRTFVFNITAPIAVVAAAAELAPERTAAIAAELGRSGSLLVGGAAALLILSSVFYTFVRSREARDLADLVTLERARRQAR